ncbi:tesmin isoform X1 [Ochotona princeps]|uniref:tesmin isoform X1 n=1 Tax=Ochotona princeps TaxID=9978 RepID=UPI00271466EF|nr:tesmin isoform X1 [Ochotona princeps]
MDEAPLLGAMPGPEEEMVSGLFGAEGQFVPENMALKPPAAIRHDEDEFHVLRDAYLCAAEPQGPLLGADGQAKVKVELLVEEQAEQPLLGEYPELPELHPLEDAALPAAPPAHTYNLHFLSSLLAPHRSPAVLPLSAWARDGAAPGVRVIPVEIKETGGTPASGNPEEARFPSPLPQEACCRFPSSQEAEDAGAARRKDSSPMVICQLKGGTQMLCIDSSGTRELKALPLLPQYQEQGSYLQSDIAKAMPTLAGRFLPVPAKFSLIPQQVDHGALPTVVSGSAFPSSSALPGPPKDTVSGYCDCFASGDFCNNCNCNNCCNTLRHEMERFKAIKATIMCSSVCKCIGCKNYEESPERKTLLGVPHCVEAGDMEDGHCLSPAKCPGPPEYRKQRQPVSCISWEVVEATCACLLAQGEEAEKEQCSQGLAEQLVLEEFGRCLSQILHIEFKSKGLNME